MAKDTLLQPPSGYKFDCHMLLIAILEFVLKFSRPAQSTLDYVRCREVKMIRLECLQYGSNGDAVAILCNDVILGVKLPVCAIVRLIDI